MCRACALSARMASHAPLSCRRWCFFFQKDAGVEGGRVSAVQEPDFTHGWRRCAGLRQIDVGLLGHGRVGQALATRIASEGHRFQALGLHVRVVAALARDGAKPRGRDVPTVFDAGMFFRHQFDAVVEVLGGLDPAYGLVRRALESGIPVVSANKTLLAARGDDLAAISRRHGVPLAFDAAVVAGVPFLGALARRPLLGAARRITGIINGTSHFLLSAVSAGATVDDALAEARARGYAEPDASADISGRDAAEKLTILLRLAGISNITTPDITTVGIDVLKPADFHGAHALGGVLKPIAMASFEHGRAGAWVGPALVDHAHPAAKSGGVLNFVEFAGDSSLPVTFCGPGAGPDITAATILDDLIEVVTTGRPEPNRPPRAIASCDLTTPPCGPCYLRISGGSLDIRDVLDACAVHGAPAVRVSGIAGTIAIRTVPVSWLRLTPLVDVLRAVGADVLALPVLDEAAS
jgi:homoserine dehydrogenase